MKRIIALLIAILLVTMSLSSCLLMASKVNKNDAKQAEAQKSTVSDADGKEGRIAEPVTKNTDLADSFEGRDDIAYVMIYNPDIYDENSENNKKLSTGKLSSWIDTDVNRADPLDEEPVITRISQSQAIEDLSDAEYDVDSEDNRAAGLQPVYRVNDKKKFYYDDYASYTTGYKNFTCVYVGNNCYIWVVDGENVSESDVKKLGDEFDQKIYPKDVAMFGTPRYSDEGGKIHLLFHSIAGTVCGYFQPYELFTSEELDDSTAEYYGLNRDHAIVHINTRLINIGMDDLLYGTMAHEFQHLINFTDAFYTEDFVFMSTWLNEAMSGYAEETQYPGVKISGGDYEGFAASDLIRKGQSLYNFGTEGYDFGVYGSVYLFSEYLAKNAGSNIFTKINRYWRSSMSRTLDDAEALYKSSDSSFVREIDGLIAYPSSLRFSTKEQEWMSKLTLGYYISLVHFDTSDPDNYKNIDIIDLLYDEINAASIEGGGRIIFATKDGQFSIPSDADNNLVYVGFDGNFNQVTKPIFK